LGGYAPHPFGDLEGVLNMSIEFFGKADKDSHGKVRSEYPAWMLTVQERELSENIKDLEGSLADPVRREMIDVTTNMEELRRAKEQYQSIQKSKPKLTGKEKDVVAENYKELSERIGASMFSYDETKRGLANAHKEAERMTEPCIEVNVELAEACNIVPDKNGKVSRNDATKMWKIFGRVLDAPTNVEGLRRTRRD